MSAGHIYVIDTALARPPKEKITLCICAADNLFFWINTKPPRQADGAFPLAGDDHHYLTHNCYLDLSRVTTFPQSELDSAKHIGPISDDLACRVVKFLLETPPKTLAGRYIKIAIANLSR